MNTIVIEGNLGRDPELRITSNAKSVCTFSVADTSGKDDRKVTQWWRVEMWGDDADAAADTLRKGNRVKVTGMALNEEWVDKDGNKRTTAKVKFAKVQRVEWTEEPVIGQQSASNGPARPAPVRMSPGVNAPVRTGTHAPMPEPEYMDIDDMSDIPF